MKEFRIKSDPMPAKIYTVDAINKKTRTILRIWIKKKKMNKKHTELQLNDCE